MRYRREPVPPSARLGSVGSPQLHPPPSGQHRWALMTRQRPRSLEEMYASYTYLLSILYLRVMDAAPSLLRAAAMPEQQPQWRVMLGRLHSGHVRPFDGAAAEDAHLLQRLWEAHARITFRSGSDAAFSPVDPAWKGMGFQDNDPVKDFRGAGRLGLEQLVYLAERHPAEWDRMLTGDFPLAIAGINVTLRMMAFLDIGHGRIVGPSTTAMAHTPFTTAKAREQASRFIFDEDIRSVFQKLNEIYCASMRLLFRRWCESNRNIMEFNMLLVRVYVEVERLLYMCADLEELCRLI